MRTTPPVVPKATFQRILKNIQKELAEESITLDKNDIENLSNDLTKSLYDLAIDVEDDD